MSNKELAFRAMCNCRLRRLQDAQADLARFPEEMRRRNPHFVSDDAAWSVEAEAVVLAGTPICPGNSADWAERCSNRDSVSRRARPAEMKGVVAGAGQATRPTDVNRGGRVAANRRFKSWEPQPRRRTANPWRTWKRPQEFALWPLLVAGAAEQRDPGDSQWGSVAADQMFKSCPRKWKSPLDLPKPALWLRGQPSNATPVIRSGGALRQTRCSNPAPANGKARWIYPSGLCGCGGSRAMRPQ
jgi:hypothetical protein